MDDRGRDGRGPNAQDIIARLRLEVDDIVDLIRRPASCDRELAPDRHPPIDGALGGTEPRDEGASKPR